MTATNIRIVEPSDLDALVALCAEHARFERAHYEAEGKSARLTEALFGPRPRLWAWIAIVDEHAIGYATVSEDFSTWNAAAFMHMDCLFVSPDRRNGGVGAALLNAVLQFARTRGIREVQWQTPDWNTNACRFYERQGAIGYPKVRFCLSIE
jgi:GNAT superfamily N-acetyltransferase